MSNESFDLTAPDIYRICGFLGMDKGTFSEELGFSRAYL